MNTDPLKYVAPMAAGSFEEMVKGFKMLKVGSMEVLVQTQIPAIKSPAALFEGALNVIVRGVVEVAFATFA
jgi:hypothetical protein